MNAHNNLLAELRKRYREEDFSWMNELAPDAEDKSDEEPERERERMMMSQENRLGETLQPNDL